MCSARYRKNKSPTRSSLEKKKTAIAGMYKVFEASYYNCLPIVKLGPSSPNRARIDAYTSINKISHYAYC